MMQSVIEFISFTKLSNFDIKIRQFCKTNKSNYWRPTGLVWRETGKFYLPSDCDHIYSANKTKLVSFKSLL